MKRLTLLSMLSQLPLLVASMPLEATPASGVKATCGASPPKDVTATTFPVTVPAQPGSTTPPTIGQPAWDYSNLDNNHDGPWNLQVSTQGGNKSSSVLYGVMMEDIDHSVDGGLYAELVQNRAFQNRTLEGWYAVEGGCIGLTNEHPLSDALPDSLEVEMGKPGDGFANEGWWGISVRPVEYKVSFWARTKQPGDGDSRLPRFKVALVSAANRTKEWASFEGNFTGGSEWTRYHSTLKPSTSAPDTNNLLTITSSHEDHAIIQFNLISLFPPTYNNRPNGVRPDLMNKLLDIDLRNCRVPGGNNLEGQTVATRWKWNETIGLLKDRPGRPGDWGYYNTDGMGLKEWLDFCEDLVGPDGETILGVYAGYSLGGESVPEGQLQEYIDEVLNELEYVLGGPESYYGSLRVRDGRQSPWDVQYIEIGNEDWFSDTYYYRFPAFYEQLKEAYPNKTFIATTTEGIRLPENVQIDPHFYGSSKNFLGLFSAWDNWPRDDNSTDVIVSEYSVQRFDNETFSPWPFMQGSVAEAVMSFGIERNSDVVKTHMYAPFFSNLHYNREGKPRMINFDADPSQTVLTPSYWVVKLLATSQPRNGRVLSVEEKSGSGPHPVYWTATKDEDSGRIWVKLANAGRESQVVSVDLGCDSAQVVSGEKEERNTDEEPDNIGIESLEVSKGDSGNSTITMPHWSVVVLSCSSGEESFEHYL